MCTMTLRRVCSGIVRSVLLGLPSVTNFAQCLDSDRRYQSDQEHATDADDDRERAGQQGLWHKVAEADRQSGYECKIDRLVYGPAFDPSDHHAKHNDE